MKEIHCSIRVTAKYLLVVALIVLFNHAFGQKENIKIIPMSPNAAEFTKYSEVPVSTFTGIPSIGIPIYTVKSGSLELPLSVSYHAGGNKVESIASWVGLSWSLGSIPAITRSVNSQPDEGLYGYFYGYNSKTVRQYYENYAGGYDAVLEDFLDRVRYDNADTEPDAFSFSINGKSGKFFFNQDIQKFVCDPYSNIKIEYNLSAFKITNDDGTQYYFNTTDREFTTTSGSTAGTPVATSWMISKIVSGDKRDTISFAYADETQTTRSIVSHTHYLFIASPGCNTLPDDATGTQMTSINAKTISSIVFRGGHVDFTKNTAERDDLYGGHSLDKIKVFDNNDVLVKQFGFKYKYLAGGGGAGCLIGDTYRSGKWMLMTNLDEISTNGTDTLRHAFGYNEAPVPPCRNSPAQDYWGYYNGVTSNIDLIPTVVVPNTTTVVTGADRTVHTEYTQFGILKRINYPTGGYTLFDYENNDSKESGLPQAYVTKTPYVAQEGPVVDDLPVSAVYDTTFVINNPPDPHLNGNNPDGGAFVSADIQNLGVPFGATGASVLIQRTSPSTPITQLYASGSFKDHYFPNGTYTLSATFNQNPPNYQDFWVILNYDNIDTTVHNAYLGGLRVKRTETYTSVTATPIVNNYTYTDTIGSSASSGVSFLKPLFNFYYLHTYGPGNCQSLLMTIRSYSNQPQVSFSGSYAGYRKVFVRSDAPNLSGMTSYAYSTMKDITPINAWPFPPAQSAEAFRGQLINSGEYRYSQGQYLPVKRSSMVYTNGFLDTTRIYAMKTSSEFLMPGDNGWPKSEGYEFEIQWSTLSKQTERSYNNADTSKYVQKITDLTYDEPFKQLTNKTTVNSQGKTVDVKSYHPYDLSLSGAPETARLWMIANNDISSVLKTETSVQSVVTNTTIANFKNFDNANLVKENEMQSYHDATDKRIIYKDYYDDYGNLVEYHQEHGIKTSYLWGYTGTYPVIEVKNSDYQTLVTTLGSSMMAALNATSPSKATIDAAVTILKSALPNALIGSYTYAPLVGMTSATDAKGQTTYYEYDSFQRLVNVKDQYGNILKHTDYHYQNQ